ELDRFELRCRGLPKFDTRSRRKWTIGRAAMDNETIDPFRKARGVYDASHGAARKTKEIEAIETSVRNNSLEILDKSFERELDPVAIRQTAAALIEPDQRMVPGQQRIPVAPDRTIHLQIDAGHP